MSSANCTRFIPLLLLVGCGGSSDSSVLPSPSGGGGTVADYVGTYSGTYYSLSASPAASATANSVGTASLTIAADGTVIGTRHDDAANRDVSLTGVITADGSLSLYDGSAGTTTIQIYGSLVKRSSEAVATLAEAISPSTGDSLHYYRFIGGSTVVGSEPLSTTRVVPGYNATYDGAWSRPEAGISGAVKLVYASSGRVSGSWTESDGLVRTISGLLCQDADTTGRYYLSGRLNLSAAGATTRQIDVRIVVPNYDGSPGPTNLGGTATDVGINGNAYALFVTPNP